MVTLTNCPLCEETYDEETDLRVHLEVEHRKSELAVYVTNHVDDRSDPVVDREQPTPPM